MSSTFRQYSPLIIALTHERELSKKTNTGRLLCSLPDSLTHRIIWQRKAPDPWLLALIESERVAILYPEQACHTANDTEQLMPSPAQLVSDFDHFILIDSTWQEARKIMNRSAYLQLLPRVSLTVSDVSRFNLRRNQVKGGLCTAEAAINLLRCKRLDKNADQLQKMFDEFVAN